MTRVPVIMHVVFSFDVGGLENGIVNLLNGLPQEEFRHVVVALTSCSEQFSQRVRRPDVEFVSLNKPPGHGWKVFRPIWKLFRQYRPAIVHTRNLAALEMQLPAWAARVPVRIHGEHGRSATDPDGSNRRHRLIRRVLRLFVTHYIAVSEDLSEYLRAEIGIPPARITRICNGVDAEKFRPRAGGAENRPLVVGCVGRLEAVKGHSELIRAVRLLLSREPERRGQFRVMVVGDGPERARLEQEIAEAAVDDVIDFCGECNDVAEVMRGFDLFVLPSLGEGISNTILESMASGLPVIATAVGGNSELVSTGRTGALVQAAEPAEMADAICAYLDDPELRARHGAQGRADVAARFSLEQMIGQYRALYRAALSEKSLQPSARAA